MWQWCRWRPLRLSLTISLFQMTQFLSLMEVHRQLTMTSRRPPPTNLMNLQQPRRRRSLPTTPLRQPPRKEDLEGPANPSQLLQNPARSPEADRTK
jgi:hypothetical protein